MAGGGALNLSLLSRGVGEVQRNGHEKVEVFLEPEDYYNFRDDPHRYYFPPIKHKYTLVTEDPQLSSRDSRDHQEIHLPKTFTTRKGALLLFSEDLALKDSERDQNEPRTTRGRELGDDTDGSVNLKTVDDLAKSILSYGNNENNSVYMKFLHRKREKFQRQIRPGFSAKRYLATWTRSWDDNVLETVINKGYITERSLFQYNFVIPHLRRRIFHEDLSHYPPPYRLMRNMLLSPGSLSGYTFYRAIPELEDMLDEYGDREVDHESIRSRPPTSIKVIRTRNGEQREVSYASLDKKSQEEVITDLLVKSAVHYALKKQQEYMTDDIEEMEAANADVPDSVYSPSERKVSSSMKTPVPQFDMKEAVESLLDSHRQPNFDADLPAIDNQSHSSDYGGSFRGANIPTHSVKGHSAKTRSWPYGIDEAGKEYIGIAPIVTLREGSSSPSGSVTSLPQLPAIKKHPLTPIKDVSRETTQNIMLPPIHTADGIPLVSVEPPTPQHSTLMKTDEQEQEGAEVHVVPTTDEDGEWKTAEKRHAKRQKGDHSHHGSMESIPHSQVQSIPSKNRPHWKGSQQSLKSVGSRKGRVDFDKYSTSGSSPHSETGSVIGDGSLKGSIICAPDGEIISVGGSVGPKQSDVAPLQDVMQVNKRVGDGEVEESPVASDLDEPEEWKESRRKVHTDIAVELTDKKHPRKESSASEQMLVDALTEHAQKIAQSVLRHSESGMNLEADIRRAATLWADRHPKRDISRSQSVQEKANTDAIEEIMKNQRTNSADVTAADYREQIRRNLTTAVAKAAGLTPESLPVDAEISPELLEALANHSLTPEDIEIVHDEESGRSTLRSKSQLSKAMGGVKEGHIYVSPGGAGEPPVSIPSERVQVKDVGDVDVISYGVPEPGDLLEQDQKSKGSSKTPSVKDGEIAAAESSRKPSESSQGLAQDDIAQALKKLEEQKTPEAEAPVSDTKSPVASEHGSTKTGISKVSQKSEDSKKSRESKKKPIPLEDREEFVVGKVEDKKELEKLYGPVDPPPPPKPSPPKIPAEKKPPEVVVPKDEPLVPVEKESPEVPKLDIPPDTKAKTPSKVPQPPKNEPKPPTKDPPVPPKPQPAPPPPKEKQQPPKKEPKKDPPAPPKPNPPPPKPKPPPPKVDEPAPPKKLPPIKKKEPASTLKRESTNVGEENKEKVQRNDRDKEETKVVVSPAVELPPLTPPKPPTISVQPPMETTTRATTPSKPEPKFVDEGRVDTKGELAQLYSQIPAPPPRKDVKGKPKQKPKVSQPLPPKEPRKKKEKKVRIEKKKVKEPPPPPPPREPTPPPKEPAKVPSPKADSPEPIESPVSPDNKSDDMEFVFVRDTTQTPDVKKDTPIPREPTPPSIPPALEESMEPDEEDDEDPGVKLISNKDARLAKRAAAAAKKREEVERRRREKEEEMRRQKEEAERQEQLRREMEEERKKRDEERRLRKLREEDERKKEEKAAADRERRKQLEMEREKRAKEEYQRKLEEMKRKQAEEEQRRLEALLERQREEEERRLQEEEMMSKMAEQERLEYERRKREEEELRRQREEEEKRRREEEAQRALEEAKRLAEEMARRQAELEARLRFNRDLQLESHGLTHTQDITRMFVFSYFELLQWLGLDIPEFELQKLAQF